MKTSDFYYDLPEAQIAQTPAEPRDSSRLHTTGWGSVNSVFSYMPPISYSGVYT